MYINTYIRTYTHTNICAYTYVNTHIKMYVDTYIHTNIKNVRKYVHTYIYSYTHTHTHTNTHTHLPFLTTEVISLYTFLKIPIHYGRITDILIIFDTLFSRQPFSTCFYIVPSRLRSICCRGQKCMVLYAQCPKCSQHGPSRYSRKTCLFKYYQFQWRHIALYKRVDVSQATTASIIMVGHFHIPFPFQVGK